MKRIACVLVTLLIGAACFGQTANKDAGQNPGFPRVVARLNLIGRVNAIGPQTLYTTPKSGVFRISGTMVCSIANGLPGVQWGTSVTWTNEAGSNAPFYFSGVSCTSVGSSGLFGANPFVFNASAGSSIEISTTPIFDTSNTKYSSYVILEQLE
jgi:hypothetical protein